MIQVICAVRDSAVNSFMRPVFVGGVGAAVRSFGDEVMNKDSPMFLHPEDYELFELGQFDDESGKFSVLPEPRQIARAKDFSRGV